MSETQPPQPPDIDRNIHFNPAQLAGTMLLLLLPVLALSGFFDVRMEIEKTSGQALELDVEYPASLRFKQPAKLKMSVRNTGDDPVYDVIVKIDHSFIQNFSNVTIHPGVVEIKNEDYIAAVAGIETGETKIITIEMEPEKMGALTGQVSVSGEGVAEFSVSIQSNVLP